MICRLPIGAILCFRAVGAPYPYTQHLLELNRRTNSLAVPAWLKKVESPLVWQEWARDLAAHVDQAFATYILEGIASGFRIGFDYDSCRCQPAASNMLSATQQAGVVQTYLEKEVALGRVIGPVDPQAAPARTQLSPFGVIPKPSQPGKWRLIVDLSSPKG